MEKPGTGGFVSSLEVQILLAIPLMWQVVSPTADSLSSKSSSFYNFLFTNLGNDLGQKPRLSWPSCLLHKAYTWNTENVQTLEFIHLFYLFISN